MVEGYEATFSSGAVPTLDSDGHFNVQGGLEREGQRFLVHIFK